MTYKIKVDEYGKYDIELLIKEIIEETEDSTIIKTTKKCFTASEIYCCDDKTGKALCGLS